MGQQSLEYCDILLVDDHKLLMEGVRSLFAPYTHIRIKGMAASGSEGIDRAASLMPDIVLMDLNMPGLNGVEASKEILHICPESRIIIYTGDEECRFLPELLDLGIMGYVRKSEQPGVLLKAVESVRANDIFVTFPDPHGAFTSLLRQRHRESSLTDINVLSPREREIFKFLANGKSVRDIAGELYISAKTVESHKYNIFTKLKIGSMHDLMRLALRYGLVRV